MCSMWGKYSSIWYKWNSQLLKKVDGWSVNQDKIDGFHLIKDFKFQNFIESQNFVNKVGEIAEIEGHHPDLWFGWGYAKIKIFTHAIKGLAESDFILAAKIDKISSVWSVLFLRKLKQYPFDPQT